MIPIIIVILIIVNGPDISIQFCKLHCLFSFYLPEVLINYYYYYYYFYYYYYGSQAQHTAPSVNLTQGCAPQKVVEHPAYKFDAKTNISWLPKGKIKVSHQGRQGAARAQPCLPIPFPFPFP